MFLKAFLLSYFTEKCHSCHPMCGGSFQFGIFPKFPSLTSHGSQVSGSLPEFTGNCTPLCNPIETIGLLPQPTFGESQRKQKNKYIMSLFCLLLPAQSMCQISFFCSALLIFLSAKVNQPYQHTWYLPPKLDLLTLSGHAGWDSENKDGMVSNRSNF